MLTEEEKKQFAKNEEKLWDMAAITAAPTLYQMACNSIISTEEAKDVMPSIATISYALADALILERRKRLKEVKQGL